jgi:hypothetical protein
MRTSPVAPFSSDFPTRNALQPTMHGIRDAFATKVDRRATLAYSTYLGGAADDLAFGIATDTGGHAYLVGMTFSPDFPTTPGCSRARLAGERDAFVVKLAPTGATLAYATFLGGSNVDLARGVAASPTGAADVVGLTLSPNLPLAHELQSTLAGGSDSFVARLSPTGSSLLFSTYLGGAGEEWGMAIATDAAGGVYVGGRTSSGDFPATAGAAQPAFAGGAFDAFVAKIFEAPASADLRIVKSVLGFVPVFRRPRLSPDRHEPRPRCRQWRGRDRRAAARDGARVGILQPGKLLGHEHGGLQPGKHRQRTERGSRHSGPAPPDRPRRQQRHRWRDRRRTPIRRRTRRASTPRSRLPSLYAGPDDATDVNAFLQYARPLAATTVLPHAAHTYEVRIYYGKTIIPSPSRPPSTACPWADSFPSPTASRRSPSRCTRRQPAAAQSARSPARRVVCGGHGHAQAGRALSGLPPKLEPLQELDLSRVVDVVESDPAQQLRRGSRGDRGRPMQAGADRWRAPPS